MMRLNKFLAQNTGISRREADEMISAGKVLVNGSVVSLGAQVDNNDKVVLNGKETKSVVNFTTVMLNKPVGYVSSRSGQGRKTVYDLLPEKYMALKTVGRLDQDSSGLLLLTNDGDFAHSMTHPKFYKVKVYEIEIDKDLEPLHQQMISDVGVTLEDGVSKLGLEKITPKKFIITMSEGRNRQIRRTFSSLGYEVVKLHRTNFGKFSLGWLKKGEFEEVPSGERK